MDCHSTARLRPQSLINEIRNLQQKLDDFQQRLASSFDRVLSLKAERLKSLAAMLESVNYQRVLERGFALVKDTSGKLVTSVDQAKQAGDLAITFKDGVFDIKR